MVRGGIGGSLRKLFRGASLRVVLGLSVALGGLTWFLLTATTPAELEPAIQERLEAGKLMTFNQVVAVGSYWAAVVNAGLVALALALSPWWSRRLPGPEKDLAVAPMDRKHPPSQPHVLAFWMVVGAALVMGGMLRMEFAKGSLWWDELWTVKQAVSGSYEPVEGKPESFEFREAGWRRALWYYQKPTNHPVASLASKASHETWRSIMNAPRGDISELAIRFPMVLASLATILLVGLLGRSWHGWAAGAGAALLLAVHPWHIRYGVDARSYVFIVLWTVLACVALTKMFRKGGHHAGWWWTVFGVTQFLLVWSFLYAAFLAAAFALVAVVLVIRGWKHGHDRVTGVLRVMAVNLLAAAGFLQVFGPNLLQMKRFLVADFEAQGHGITVDLFQDFLSQWLTGLPYFWPETQESEGLPSLVSRLGDAPWLMWPALLMLAFALGAGLWAVFRKRDAAAAWILGAVLAAGVLSLGYYVVSGTYFYGRFLVFLLVPSTILLAIGLAELSGRVAGRPRGVAGRPALAPLALAVTVVVIFVATVLPQLRALATRSYEPLREVVDRLNDKDEPLRAIYGHGGETVEVYDPRVRVLTKPGQLEALMRRARAESRMLRVAYGHAQFNRTVVPFGFELLDNPSLFREVAVLPGVEPQFFYRVFEYTGQAAP